MGSKFERIRFWNRDIPYTTIHSNSVFIECGSEPLADPIFDMILIEGIEITWEGNPFGLDQFREYTPKDLLWKVK